MKKKRSVGVVIFAWLIIIGTISNILSFKEGQKINPPISTYFYIFILPVSLISAIYLLKLKNWARVAIIIISLFMVIETLVTTPYVMHKGRQVYSTQFEQGYDEVIKALTEESNYKPNEVDLAKTKEFMASMNNIVIPIFIFHALAFNIAVIFFFTRPKVKAQFNIGGPNA